MQEYNVFEMITADQRPNRHLYIDAKKMRVQCVYMRQIRRGIVIFVENMRIKHFERNIL